MNDLPADWSRPLGTTGLTVSTLCAGAGPLGRVPDNAAQGVPTARRILEGPITFLDTSNNYCEGESERCIGAALAERGGLPDGFVLATKVDRAPDSNDFSGARVRRSVEESLERLGLDRIQLLYLHDPEYISFAEGMAADGPVRELARIRDEGLADHVGVAGGPVDLLGQYLETGVFEALITHNRYTLVDRSADQLIAKAHERGVAVVNAAAYGGGILAKGTAGSTRYAYREAPADVLDAVRAMEDACGRYGVPLAAAAAQFSMRDARIASTIVGFSKPEQVDAAVAQATWPIPDELWTELERHVPSSEYWLY